MKKDAKLDIRVTQNDLAKLKEIAKLEDKSVSDVIRELINYRYNYLAKKTNMSIPVIKETNCNNTIMPTSSDNVSDELLNEFKRALSC